MSPLARIAAAALLCLTACSNSGKTGQEKNTIDPSQQRQGKSAAPSQTAGGARDDGGNGNSSSAVDSSDGGASQSGAAAANGLNQNGQNGQPNLAALGPLKIGASPTPHAELINAVLPELKAQGINVQVQVFEDYGVPNTAVVRGDLDANFFQTEPYLWRWRAAHGGDLTVAGRIHVEPMGVWSKKVTNIGLVRQQARVALPSDPANLGRALFLLRKADLIELDDRKGLDAIVSDVTSNPHLLKFDLESAEKVTKLYGSDDLIVANGNYALEAKLPLENALVREDATSPFPNVVVCLQSKVNDPRIVALVAALRGPTARAFMQTKYGGAVLPAP